MASRVPAHNHTESDQRPDPRRRSRPRASSTPLRKAVAAALGLALIAAAGSCGGSDANDSAGSTTKKVAADGPLSATALVAKVRPSTVSVVTQPPGEARAPTGFGQHAHGSGIIYDAARGLVLVSNHLVENAGTIDATVEGGTKVHARLVARAQCNDMALIALNPKPLGIRAIEMGRSGALQPGDEVTAIGYLKPASAKTATLIRTSGEVSAVNVSSEVTPGLPAFPSVVLHQAPMQLQMSGGPVVNDRGQLIGLATVLPGEGNAGTQTAVSSDYLKKRLAELKPGPGRLLVGWQREHVCHAQMAKIAAKVLVSHGAPGHSGHS